VTFSNGKMPPHRRNSQDTAVGGAASAEGSFSEAGLNGLKRFDPVNGPYPCASPNGCLYHNGSNAEHILINKVIQQILKGDTDASILDGVKIVQKK
jgi:hypothetical protein